MCSVALIKHYIINVKVPGFKSGLRGSSLVYIRRTDGMLLSQLTRSEGKSVCFQSPSGHYEVVAKNKPSLEVGRT